ncbi:MAG: F-type H+/Na+-transporting ATPase subunit beta, partial [Baekduia sp.]|nr:F-type H+/Na+-transporting ATPase subunit beta [Baekduia sp.]
MEASTTERPTGAETSGKNVGRIEEIQGVVIEAVFPDKLPNIYNAIRVRLPEAAKAEEGASSE